MQPELVVKKDGSQVNKGLNGEERSIQEDMVLWRGQQMVDVFERASSLVIRGVWCVVRGAWCGLLVRRGRRWWL